MIKSRIKGSPLLFRAHVVDLMPRDAYAACRRMDGCYESDERRPTTQQHAVDPETSAAYKPRDVIETGHASFMAPPWISSRAIRKSIASWLSR
jgi:hypothetical protein